MEKVHWVSIHNYLVRKKNTNCVSTNTQAFYHKCSFIQSCQNLLFNEGWEHLKLDDPWLLGQRFFFYNKWLQINVWGSSQHYGGSRRWIECTAWCYELVRPISIVIPSYYTFCCSFTQNVHSLTSTVETIHGSANECIFAV